MKWPITVWPGAVCFDWFGVFAFYTSLLMLVVLVILVTAIWVWLICKIWRMRYRNESWLD